MKSLRMLLVLMSLGVSTLAVPAWAQSKSERTTGWCVFPAEPVDPALKGTTGRSSSSLMSDYLAGTTADGQPSQAGGLASKWENSADHRRWTFHLRKGVKFHNGDEM